MSRQKKISKVIDKRKRRNAEAEEEAEKNSA